jgi:hypothetical protein
MSVLNTLLEKHMILQYSFEDGGYEALPCGDKMSICNNAFVELCDRFDDLLGAIFNEAPRGDP